jgi:hypothetical protein
MPGGKPKKPKITKKLKEIIPKIWVRLTDQTSPKFAHNAIQRNKDVFWTYEFWKESDTTNVGQLVVQMDLNKYKNMNENKQSQSMNDEALAEVRKNYKDHEVKLTSR